MSKLDDLEVKIAYQEGPYVSYEEGYLTKESKEKLKKIMLKLTDTALKESETYGQYVNNLQRSIKEL